MRKVFCDLCGKEIKEPAQDIRGTFENHEGVLVKVEIKSPTSYADLCKPCVIDIIQNGKPSNWMERKYNGEKVS